MVAVRQRSQNLWSRHCTRIANLGADGVISNEGQCVAGVAVRERGGAVPSATLRGWFPIRADAVHFG
jgi:hypothetical protein